ncbi:hypothetical protein Tco_1431340, partial [Tanacetum coccineum]
MFAKTNPRKKEAKNIDTEIALEKKVKELDNIVCKMSQSTQTVHMLTKPQVFYDNNLKQALGFQNPFYLKKAQQIRQMLYDSNVIAKENNVILIADSEETLMLEEEIRSKMLLKQNFGKRFVSQRVLSDEQALHPINDQSAASPVKIEAPRELPKVSLVNTSLKKLKYHLGQFDNVVKKRIMPNALTEGEWGFEHTKTVFQNEIILFLKTLKDMFNVFDKDILNEVMEVQTVFNKIEVAVQQYHVDKQCFEIQMKQFLMENDRLLDQIISQDIVNIVVNSTMDVNTPVKVNSSVVMNDSVNYVEMCNKCLELEAELIKQHNMVEKDEYNRLSKRFSDLEQHCISLEITMQLNKEIFQRLTPLIKNDLRKLKGKDIVANAAQMSNAATIAPEMYKLDPVILAPKVKNNKEAHEYYIKHTMEQAAILREELLGYVRDTCPDIHKPSEKLVAVTPINMKKIVRFVDTITSSGNIPKVTNRPILSSTGLNPSTNANGSKPSGNIKNDKISQTPSSNKKNKVEVQSRKVESSLNKRNSDSKNICNKHVKHPVKGAKALCIVCNECLFDANHAMCLIDHVNSMNVSDKSASKKNKKRKEWKPTRKVFNSVGYKWKPTRRNFTLVGNGCPLTRLTATSKVHRVYTKRPKVPKSVQHSKPNVAKSMIA